MIAALLLAAAAPAPMTAIDAERAFARDAQTLGQWTAFRKWAAPDAIMFTPQPVKAQEWLKGRKDPPIAVQWRPAKMIVSCDGTTAVTTGSWVRPGSVGYFTTVWERQKDGGWKWVFDHGDVLKKPRAVPKKPMIVETCPRLRGMNSLVYVRPENGDVGASPDASLEWEWAAPPKGGHWLKVSWIYWRNYPPGPPPRFELLRDVVAAE